jgi:hypothetical protein
LFARIATSLAKAEASHLGSRRPPIAGL